MPSNSILPFAQGGTANVMAQATYAAHAQRMAGNQPGVANSQLVNKAMRQMSAMAAGIAQFLADYQTTQPDINDSLLAAALSAAIAEAVRNAASPAAGAIVWVPSTAAIPGTVKANGALLSRTSYARLWTFAQASGNLAANDGAWQSGQFSPGDGSTTFRILDLRGYVIRATDEGRGVDAGRIIGTVQADQNLVHSHIAGDPGHAHTASVTDPQHSHPINVEMTNESGSGDPFGSGGGADEGPYSWTSGPSATGISVTIISNLTGITIGTDGGTEARMKNIALTPVIYY